MGRKARVQRGRVCRGGVEMGPDAKIQAEKKGRSPGQKAAIDVLGTSKGRGRK